MYKNMRLICGALFYKTYNIKKTLWSKATVFIIRNKIHEEQYRRL